MVFIWRFVNGGIVRFRHSLSYVLLGIVNMLLSVYTVSSFVRILLFLLTSTFNQSSRKYFAISRGILGSGGNG